MSAHTHPLPSLTWQRPRGGALVEGLRRAWRVVTTRQGLAELDDHMLRDIGVTRAEVLAELHRAPWDRDGR